MPDSIPSGSTATTKATIVLGLVLLVALVFGRSLQYGYVNIDDDRYITDNPPVQHGLTREGLAWAFGFQQGFWIPLTWLSYMAECEAGPPKGEAAGCRPSVHHATNVFLHATSTVVLFLLLTQITALVWRSALVAAIFAVHPLHVESVVWITERKDVLSTTLGLFALWAYALYVGARATRTRAIWYGGALVLFLFSLSAKPMFVTLPALMLLLDYWPLRRCREMHADMPHQQMLRNAEPWHWLLVEKVPFVALSAIFSVLTTLAWKAGPDYKGLSLTPLAVRVKSALAAYSWYLYKHFIPTNLAVHYAYRSHVKWGVALASAAVIASITVLAVVHRKRFPYFAAGWLWFVGTLLPVAGFVRYGGHSYADRFSYVPSIGLGIAVVWAVAEFLRSSVRHEVAEDLARVAAVAPVAAFAWLSIAQVSVWKDSLTLFTHAVKVAPDDGLNHHNLGEALVASGQYEKAIEHFQAALRISPNRANTENSLGNAYNHLGRSDEAVAHFSRAIELDKKFALAWTNLAGMLTARGELNEALELHEEAVELEPSNPRSRFFLANAYRDVGRFNEAMEQYRKSIELEPKSAETRNNYALVLMSAKRVDEAIVEFRSALALAPTHAEVNNNLGVALYSKGQKAEAISHFRRALVAQPQYLDAQRNLAIAMQD